MVSPRHSQLLFLGDVVILGFSLWLTLFIRHLSWPDIDLFLSHLGPFSVLFFIWVVVFFIAGLYERYTVMFQRELPQLLLKVQIINVVVAVVFFYSIPFLGLAPKTNLFIYLIVSFCLLFLWRLYGFGFFSPKRKSNAIIVGSGFETKELIEELRHNPYSSFRVVFSVNTESIDNLDIESELINRILAENVHIVIMDANDPTIKPLLPHLYKMIFFDIRFYDIHLLYQNVFGRVPLSLLHYTWFLNNVSVLSRRRVYNFVSRLIDLGASFVLTAVLLPVILTVAVLVKFIDGHSVFFVQNRVGRHNKTFSLVKFKTMRDQTDLDQDDSERLTPLGRFLRRTRLDELPQLYNVWRGDLSLVGPRPEKPDFVQYYEQEIPFYHIRHLIKPGLSGWAQLYHPDPPRHNSDIERTKQKLSYDLYYLANRSLILDLKVAFKTLKVLILRNGS